MSIQNAINSSIRDIGVITSIATQNAVEKYKAKKASEKKIEAEDEKILADLNKNYSNVEKAANVLGDQAAGELTAANDTINSINQYLKKDDLADVQNKLKDIDDGIKGAEETDLLNLADKATVDKFINKYGNKDEFSNKYGKTIEERINNIKKKYDAYNEDKAVSKYMLNDAKSTLAKIEQRLIQSNIQKAKAKQEAMKEESKQATMKAKQFEKDKNEFISKYGINTYNRFKDQIDKELNNG